MSNIEPELESNIDLPCEICKKDKNNIMFLTHLPCNHQLCLSCLSQIKDARCPYCREDFGEKMKKYCPLVSFEGRGKTHSEWEINSPLRNIMNYSSPMNESERLMDNMFNSDVVYMNVWNSMDGPNY